jgi:quercetin dioxygenase-like cupin family protein
MVLLPLEIKFPALSLQRTQGQGRGSLVKKQRAKVWASPRERSSNRGGRAMTMHRVRQENLPFVGSSHEFIGAEQGDTGVSVFLYHGKPGSVVGRHRHPYDEIQFIREGRVVWTVSGKTFEGRRGYLRDQGGRDSQL